MKASHEIENEHLITEGLKMILNLCKFRENGDLIDFYESESFMVDELRRPDKYILDSILRAEFT